MQSWHRGAVGQGAQRLLRNRACIRPRSLLTPKQGHSFLPVMGWTLTPHAVSRAASRGRHNYSFEWLVPKSSHQDHLATSVPGEAAEALKMKGTPATLPHSRQDSTHSKYPSTQGTRREIAKHSPLAPVNY